MYRLVFHSFLQTDYDEAYAWYEDKLEGLGERFLASANKKLSEILKRPEAFGVRAKKDYREASIEGFPYSIIYKIYKKEKEIFIVSVHNQNKHPQKKYRKR